MLRDNPVSFNDWVTLSYGDNDLYYYDKPVVFMSQLDWLVDDQEKQAVNSLGCFENLQNDFDRLRTSPGPGHVTASPCQKVGKTRL